MNINRDNSSIDESSLSTPFLLNNPKTDDSLRLTRPLFTEKIRLRDRLFSPMNHGSFRGVTLTILTGAFGAGILALPQACEQVGIINAYIMLIISFIASHITITMLNRSAEKLNMFNFSQLFEIGHGKRMRKYLEFLFCIFMFGISISYQIIVSNVFKSLMLQLANYQISETQRAIQILVASLVSFFFCLKKSFSGLSYVFLTGIGIMVYIVLTVIVETPIYMLNDRWSKDNIVYFKWDFKGFFSSFGVIIFAFEAHTFYIQTLSEMQRPIRRRLDRVRDYAMGSELLVYMIIATCGYISTPGVTPDLIVMRESLDGGLDYPLVVGEICLMGYLSFSQVMNFIPARQQLLQILDDPNPGNPSTKFNLVSTFCFIGFGALVAIFMPSIYSVIGIIGGYCGILYVITFPSLIYVKINCTKKGPKKIGVILFNIIFTLVGFISATITLVETINN